MRVKVRAVVIFCVIVTLELVAARPQIPLAAMDDYQQYGIDLAKIEDDLIEQTSADNDKVYLEQLFNRWKTSTEYAVESSSRSTTERITTPETITAITPDIRMSTIEMPTTTEATKAATALNNDLPNKNQNFGSSFIKPFQMAIGNGAAFQLPPIFSYYPLPPTFNIMPPSLGLPQIPSTLPGLHMLLPVQSLPQMQNPFYGFQGLPQAFSAYNPYTQYSGQFITPAYNTYRQFKK